MFRIRTALVAIVVVTIAEVGFVATSAEAPARQAGVASAVVPQSTGTPPQQARRVLQVGIDLQVDERVETGERGKTQLLFLDGSALTVGPNSDVTLDSFVYDPDAKTGELALSSTKGLFRFVGGRISKKQPVVLKTPTATIGIRGGVFTARVSQTATRATFHFGEQMSVSAAGVTKNTQRPGNAISVEGDGPPSDPAPASGSQLSEDLGGLEKSDEDSDAEAEVEVSDADVAETQIAELGSGSEPDAIGGGATSPGDSLPTTGDADDNADVVDSQNDQRDNSQNATPAITGATISNFAGGRGKRGTSTDVGTLDSNTGQNFPLTSAAVSNGLFTATTSAGSYRLFVPDTAGTFTLGDDTTSRPAETPFGLTTGSGFLSDNKDFVLFELSGSRQVVFGGVETPSSAIPTSGASRYLIRPDFALGNSNIPGLPASQGGNLTTSQTTALIHWENSGASNAIRPVFAGAMAATGTGSSQKSAVGLLIGRLVTTSGGKTLIAGGLGGTSSITGTLRLFEGGGSSATNGATGGFLGQNGPDFAVIEGRELTSSGTTDTSEPLGLEVVTAGTTSASDTTVFPNLVLQKQTTTGTLTRSNHTTAAGNALKGFASGILNSYTSTGTFFRSTKLLNQLTGPSAPTDVVVQTELASGRVEADFKVRAGLSGGPLDNINLDFGGLTANPGDSAFNTDDRFGAFSITSGTTLDGLTALDTEAAMASLSTDDLTLGTGVLPSGVSLCTCSFATWGFWGGTVEESNGDEHFIHLATWVASEVTAASQIPLSGSATYSGPVLGSVVEGPLTAPTAQYFTGGTANLVVSFGSTSYSVSGNISNLAGATFNISSSAIANNNTAFFASISDNIDPTGFPGTYSGTMNVSFAGSGTPPAGQIGQAAISNSNSPVNWQFSGIYMGEKQ